jgi:serine/threonine protein kinase
MKTEKKRIVVGEGISGIVYNDYGKRAVKIFNYQLKMEGGEIIRKLSIDERAHMYAPKLFDDPGTFSNAEKKRMRQLIANYYDELAVLKRLQGKPNIVQLIEPLDDGTRMLGFSMELVPDGTLENYVHCISAEEPTQRIETIDFISIQLMTGLNAIHAEGIAHLDIRPSNLLVRLVSEKYFIKICDFSNSYETIPETFNVVSASYRAPEIFNEEKWECMEDVKKADIWYFVYLRRLTH